MSDENVDISVCVTTKNVEDTIDRCLQSVSGWAAEIVVIDSDSQDRTIDICESFDAKIYQHEFSGFSDLYRTAISKAENEWVLILDADEEVSDPLQQEIIEELKSPTSIAYSIPLKTNMFDDWVRTSQSKTCLGKRDCIEFRQEYVHSKMTVSEEYEGQVGALSSPIHHYTYDRVSDYLNKFDQYTSLEALRHFESEHTPNYLKFIAKAFAVAFYHLFINRAILDGYRGVLFATMSFQYQIVSHAKIRDIKRLKDEKPDNWKQYWIEEECKR